MGCLYQVNTELITDTSVRTESGLHREDKRDTTLVKLNLQTYENTLWVPCGWLTTRQWL